MLVIFADQLDQDVERARADDDVLELGESRELVRDVPQIAVGADADERLAGEADRERVGDRHDLHHVVVEKAPYPLAHRSLGQPDRLGEGRIRAAPVPLKLFH